MSFEVLVAVGLAILVVIVALVLRHLEIKEFNNGQCKCGGKLENFDQDSQGGTGWACDRCRRCMWTSWV